LNIQDVSMRIKFQRTDGKEMEIDLKAESDCGSVILIEVKKMKKAIGVNTIRDFIEKIDRYSDLHPKQKVLPAILSVGGFTTKAKALCQSEKIGMATTIPYLINDQKR